jgi:hypothetical protein
MKAEIKKFILRALGRMEGLPMRNAALNEAVQEAMTPSPPILDVEEARRELEQERYIQGTIDEFSKQSTWTLTDKGKHKSKTLG